MSSHHFKVNTTGRYFMLLFIATDNLYKLSLQTMNADAFLKQRQPSPTPASPSPPPPPPPASLAYGLRGGTYSSIVNSSCSKWVQICTSSWCHKHRILEEPMCSIWFISLFSYPFPLPMETFCRYYCAYLTMLFIFFPGVCYNLVD